MVHRPLTQHLQHTGRLHNNPTARSWSSGHWHNTYNTQEGYTTTPQPGHGPPATDTTPTTHRKTTQQPHSQVLVQRPLTQHLQHTGRLHNNPTARSWSTGHWHNTYNTQEGYTTTPQPSHGPPATDTTPTTHRKATQQPHSQVMVHRPLTQHLQHTERLHNNPTARSWSSGHWHNTYNTQDGYTTTPQPGHGPPATDTTPTTHRKATQQPHSQVMVHRPLTQHLQHTERLHNNPTARSWSTGHWHNTYNTQEGYTTTPQPSHGPPATDTTPTTHRKATQQPHSQVMVHRPLTQHLQHTGRLHNNPTAKSWSTGHWHNTYNTQEGHTTTPQPSHGPPATDTTPTTHRKATQQPHSQVMVHRPLTQHLQHTERLHNNPTARSWSTGHWHNTYNTQDGYTTTPQPSHGPPATDTTPTTHRKATQQPHSQVMVHRPLTQHLQHTGRPHKNINTVVPVM